MSNDLWRTPSEVINFVESRFGKIEIDLCASYENSVVPGGYLDESDNFLDDKWIGKIITNPGDTCWCNPPYSNPRPFVEQCVKWSVTGYRVVMLLNMDVSTRWYQLIQDNAAVIMPIVGGRVSFLNGDGVPVKGNAKPQMLCVFAPFGRSTQNAITEPVHIEQIYTGQTT